MTAAILQIAGAALIVLAAALISITLGVFVAGTLTLAFGIWEELS